MEYAHINNSRVYILQSLPKAQVAANGNIAVSTSRTLCSWGIKCFAFEIFRFACVAPLLEKEFDTDRRYHFVHWIGHGGNAGAMVGGEVVPWSDFNDALMNPFASVLDRTVFIISTCQGMYSSKASINAHGGCLPLGIIASLSPISWPCAMQGALFFYQSHLLFGKNLINSIASPFTLIYGKEQEAINKAIRTGLSNPCLNLFYHVFDSYHNH